MGLFDLFTRKKRPLIASDRAETQSAKAIFEREQAVESSAVPLEAADSSAEAARLEKQEERLSEWAGLLSDKERQLEIKAAQLRQREEYLVKRETEPLVYADLDFNSSIYSLVKLAKAGNTRAQHVLGLATAFGAGVKVSPVLAEQLLNDAAESNDIDAQFSLGFLAVNEIFLTSAVDGKAWLKRATENGVEKAENILSREEKIEQNTKTKNQAIIDPNDVIYEIACRSLNEKSLKIDGLKLLEVLSDAGHVDAKVKLASLIVEGGKTNVSIKSIQRVLGRLASTGDADAQYLLGKLLLSGHGDGDDIEMAVYWLDLASSQGHQDARSLLRQIPSPASERQKSNIEHEIEDDDKKVSRWYKLGLKRGLACRNAAISAITKRYGSPTAFMDLEASVRNLARRIADERGLLDPTNLFGFDEIYDSAPNYSENCDEFVKGIRDGLNDEE